MKRTVVVTLLALGLGALVFARTNLQTLTPVVPNPPATATEPPVAPLAVPAPQPPAAPAVPQELTALVWDAETKEYNAQPGEMNAPFVFNFTNVSASVVVISNLQTSCGCTAAQMPETPWHIAAGTNGEIKATMNLTGKQGAVTKQITVNTSHGSKPLYVKVNIPAAPPAPVAAENARGDRNANIELAKTDRQAVFKGDCRSCHVDPGVGKHGKELYDADCGVCHDSHIRAAMVPDLRAPKAPRDRDYWVTWITYGRGGTMMPAFGEKEGGPLSQEQIDSLVAYLVKEFPQAPVAVPAPAPNNAAPAANPTPGAGQ